MPTTTQDVKLDQTIKPLTVIRKYEKSIRSAFNLDDKSFVESILNLIPESNYLNGAAEVSLAQPDAKSQQKSQFYGLTGPEAMRGFSGLLCFKHVYNGDKASYELFTAGQKDPTKPTLTWDSFQQMHHYVKEKIENDSEFAAITWSILCNDLAKTNKVKNEYKGKTASHDIMLAQLLQKDRLENNTNLFPGFMQLDSALQEKIIAGYNSGCDISQTEESELPLVSLLGLKALDKKSLDLYVLHSIFDVAGAEGHFDVSVGVSSTTMHENTWRFFNKLRESLENFYKKQASIEDVYHDYINFRGRDLGIINNSQEHFAMIRMASLARLSGKEQGSLFQLVWNKFDSELKNILIKELNIPGDKDPRAIFVAFGAAIMNNAKAVINLPDALTAGLTSMAKVFQATRQIMDVKKNTVTKPYVGFCPEIAGLLKTDPKSINEIELRIAKNKATGKEAHFPDDEGILRRTDFTVVKKNLTHTNSIAGTGLAANSIFAKPILPATTKPITDNTTPNITSKM